eukprot:TRINITY_DN13543_c0_g1_i1.p1 TRINITY_DN13543_c0_g1~~TRINITY_DN13543_c0_g1_i1.p1  ORF type:complete len:567 (-),score=119.89 TRINITY_DN13543_c0_g1_i1:63-1763(-)
MNGQGCEDAEALLEPEEAAQPPERERSPAGRLAATVALLLLGVAAVCAVAAARSAEVQRRSGGEPDLQGGLVSLAAEGAGAALASFDAVGTWSDRDGEVAVISEGTAASSMQPSIAYLGGTHLVTSVGPTSFKTAGGFCGGSALYTADTIQCASGAVFVRQQPALQCHSWPDHQWRPRESFQENCLHGNGLDDGFRYVYNYNRGKLNAACGQAAQCWCCRQRLLVPLLDPEQASKLEFQAAVDIDGALQRLRAAGKRNVIFAMFSKELLAMTRNFLCSVSTWLPKTSVGLVIIAFNTDCTKIEATAGVAFGGIQCVSVTPKAPPPASSNNVIYESDRYKYMVGMKLTLWSLCLKMAVLRGGFDWFVNSDVDVVIKKDPVAFMQENPAFIAHAKAISHGRPLIYCMRDNFVHVPHGQSQKIRNTGFCFVPANEDSVQMLVEAMDNLKKGESYDNGDQGAINHLALQHRNWIVPLPWQKFSNGLLHFGYHMTDGADVIHAQWIKNSAMKEQCLRLSGEWYLGEDACQAPVAAGTYKTSDPNTPGAKVFDYHGVKFTMDRYRAINCTAA